MADQVQVWILICALIPCVIPYRPMVIKLYIIRKNENAIITAAIMANPRLKPGAMLSFFIISTRAKQKDRMTKIVMVSDIGV